MHDSALLSTATALHIVFAVMRRHRARPRGVLSLYVFPSFVFAATPWLWTSPTGLAVCASAHVLWMVLCETLAPPAVARATPVGNRAPTRAEPQAVSAPQAKSDARSHPPRSGFVKTSVLAVLEETPEIRTFRLVRPADFNFVPGQFIAVRVQIEGRPHVRCYSLSSPPGALGYLEISVRRQGLVSNMLHSSLRPGSLLNIGYPAGSFTYPANDDRPLALLAAGIGITPLLSMLQHAVTVDPSRPITVLYSARREQDVAFAADLRLIAARHPQVTIAVTLSKPDRQSQWRTGRIDAEMIRQYIGSPGQTIFCLCGPGDMIRDLSALLASLAVPLGQIRSEHFETAVAAANLNVSAVPVASVSASMAGGDRGLRVSFSASRREGRCAEGRTLLEAAEDAGVSMASLCRAGVCQSCRTRVVDGEVDCRSDMLDPDDRAAGFILPCVSWPLADCVLDA